MILRNHGDKGFGPGPRNGRKCSDGGEVQQAAALKFRNREPGRICLEYGGEHFVPGFGCLYENPAAPGAPADDPGRAGKKRHDLLICTVARSEELCVKVKKCHDIGLRYLMKYSLGPDIDASIRQHASSRRSGDFDDEAARSRL